MLREVRRLHAPELDAAYEGVETRVPFLRIGALRSRNVASDWGLVDRASGFTERMSRPCATVLLDGHGRFDEGARRLAVAPGDLAVSDQREGGTEAYAGASMRALVLEWDPSVLGAMHRGAVSVVRLSAKDRARLSSFADALESDRAEGARAGIVDVLRSVGLGFDRLAARELSPPSPPGEIALARALGRHLSNLPEFPAIDELAGELGWNARRIHRGIAALGRRYAIPWEHWRSALHNARITTALRILSAPGATTELAARLTGFRAAAALCHAFADAGLPSPGVLAREARGDVIDAWAAHSARASQVRAA